jgi:hypothetical protein
MFLVVPTLQRPEDGEQGWRRGYVSEPQECISEALLCSLKPKIAWLISGAPVTVVGRRRRLPMALAGTIYCCFNQSRASFLVRNT